MNTIISRLMKALLFLMIAMLLVSCGTSSKTIKQKESRDSASVRTEFVWLTKKVHDSIYLRDSVFVEKRGDTVYLNKWRTRYRERLVHDTIIVETTDTIRIKKWQVKEVLKSPSFFQMWRAYIIGAMAILFIIACAFVAYKIKP